MGHGSEFAEKYQGAWQIFFDGFTAAAEDPLCGHCGAPMVDGQCSKDGDFENGLRWHVETVSGGIVINEEARSTKVEAEALAVQRTEEIADANRQAAVIYEIAGRDSVLETEASDDQIPSLICFDYVYRVAPCAREPEWCVACLEMEAPRLRV